MDILLEYCATETIVKKSRFIAELFPIETQAEARDVLKNQKQKYADAAHVVHAFVCGLEGQISGMSDDGEPSGTAGRPAYDVLKGRNLTNLILTITRYFGGTLLGTGGLVKAYGDAAREVLDKAKTERYIPKIRFCFKATYEVYEGIKRSIAHFPLTNAKEEFLERVGFQAEIPLEHKENLSAIIKDVSKAMVTVDFL